MLRVIEPILPSEQYVSQVIQNPDVYLFEQKWDGFRCAAYAEDGVVTLRTKVSKVHTKFREIREAVAGLAQQSLVLDGELVYLNEQGHPSFDALMRGHKPQYYYVFDLLVLNDLPVHILPLWERKKTLKEFLERVAKPQGLIRYVPFVAGKEGAALIERVQTGDLEGLVAKLRDAPYDATLPGNWVKVLHKNYSQGKNRWKWFRKPPR